VYSGKGPIMSPDEIVLVQGTWQQIVPLKDTAAELFYGKLFELDPSLRPLFKGDMTAQGSKLMTMLGAAVTGLTRLDALVPVVRDLGRRHAAYGVKLSHYATVAAALVWTLEQGLGSSFTTEVRDAWVKAYSMLAKVMQDAAAEAALPA